MRTIRTPHGIVTEWKLVDVYGANAKLKCGLLINNSSKINMEEVGKDQEQRIKEARKSGCGRYADLQSNA